MRRLIAAGVGVAGMVLGIGPFVANAGRADVSQAGLPSSAGGFALVQALCVECHLLPGADGGQAVTVGVPSLSGIANKPGQTGAAIEAVLIKPHAPMPDMKLSLPEIRDIIAYLDSLRTDKRLPPLQEPVASPPKPNYPAPS